MNAESTPNRVEINAKKSFRGNLEAGCTKEQLMEYYCIDTEKQWEKIMDSIKDTSSRKTGKKHA